MSTTNHPLSIIAPALAGGTLAALAAVGLVYAQTSPPATNPAEQPILTYSCGTSANPSPATCPEPRRHLTYSEVLAENPVFGQRLLSIP